jgi:excinuclease UvrABC nuclease subunit
MATIEGDFYSWSEENVNKVQEKPAKYELYDESRLLLYIGSTGNLSERFKHYLSTDFDGNPCKRRTRSYKRQYVNTEQEAKRLEEENLKEYQARYGKLPSCNERIG